MEDSNKKEVIQFGKGLYTDSSPQVHRLTLRFALNLVLMKYFQVSKMESFISRFFQRLHPGVYIGNGETVIFLVGPNNESEFGVYSDKGIYTTYINDSSSIHLNPTSKPPLSVYRLVILTDKTSILDR